MDNPQLVFTLSLKINPKTLVINTPKSNQRICFVHIPKTAETSVTQTLTLFYQKKHVFPGLTMIDYNLYTKQQLLSFNFYKGHIPLRHGLSILEDGTQYVTLLRDPVKRIVSLYFFWKYYDQKILDDPNISDFQKIGPKLAKKYDLISFLELDDPYVHKATSNVQLQYLSSYAWHELLGKRNNEIIDDAYDNLKYFSVIGIQENLSFFMHQLKELTGFNLPIKIKHHNISKSNLYFSKLSNNLQSKAIDLILNKNKEEIQLYDKVKKNVQNHIKNTNSIEFALKSLPQ